MNLVKKIVIYLSALFKEYKKNKPKYKFRIEGFDERTMVFGIKIIGKNMIFKSSAQKLVENSDITKDFSYEDIKTIFRYYYNVKPTYQIIEIIMDDNDFSVKIAYKKRGTNKTEIKSPDELVKNKDLLYAFPPKDIQRICLEAKNKKSER